MAEHLNQMLRESLSLFRSMKVEKCAQACVRAHGRERKRGRGFLSSQKESKLGA